MTELCRRHGISDATFYTWRSKYGGLEVSEMRRLRRYRRRWKVERLFAWLHNFRRLVVRWDRRPENFPGFVHLACTLILLRRYL